MRLAFVDKQIRVLMDSDSAVYRQAKKGVISARYPLDRIKLVEAVQHREGYEHLSDAVSRLLDEGLERRGLLDLPEAA